MKTLILDIETAPLPDEEQEVFMPEDLKVPKTADDMPEDCYLKDGGPNKKGREWIAKNTGEGFAQRRREWFDGGALAPERGRIICGQYAIVTQGSWVSQPVLLFCQHDDEQCEHDVIAALIEQIEASTCVIGFYSNSFDVRNIYLRSAILGMRDKTTVALGWLGKKWLDEKFLDLVDVLDFGSNKFRNVKGRNLGYALKMFGLGEKKDDGADFHKWPRDKQEEYARKDIADTAALARALGVI